MPVRRSPILRFDCTLCTDCCTKYVPLIVSEDVRRILVHARFPVRDFIRFFRPDRVALPPQDDTWIRTRHGRRAMGLRKMRGGRCFFLRGVHCSIHEFKPLLCRMYPFNPLNPNQDRVRFNIPRNEPCPAERRSCVPLEPLRLVYDAYSDSTWSYVEEVQRWNRASKGHGTTSGFLRFLGLV